MKKLFHANLALFAAVALAPEGLSSVAGASEAVALGLTGKVAFVHKKDAEGMLQIDAFTGQVVPGQHDRPEWADGLVLAQLAARHIFYASRLGEKYADAHKSPEVFAYEDLDWLGLDMETGDEITLEADSEFRMEVMSTVLDIDRETGDIKGVLAETEIASDHTRTAAELAALEEAQAARFAATGTGE
ncbi:hypothetical protein [Aminobacter sp. HY435]|uniref:hypothetical protein n=1 Tax=Aminobacter sp. HY435 TaxID=2970917 RepID=UPI0022B98F55|nr:hypothetical protein [Aminobacter sp. HY435]